MEPGTTAFNAAIGAAIVGVVMLIWFLMTYNRLINLRNLILNAWSNVDTELKRRYDLIPNLVKAVAAYARHEREVLRELTEWRARCVASTANPCSQAADENQMIRVLRQVLVVAENYPDLKASRNFLSLQRELSETEDRIQAARRFYNGNVKDYNNIVEMLPSNVVAGLCGFSTAEYFEIEDSRERSSTAVEFSSQSVGV